MSAAELEVALRHRYGGGAGLDIGARVPLAGVTAVFGPSGSGKTTLLDCVAGLRPEVTDARVTVAGEVWQDGDSYLPAWRRSVAYVFQAPHLFPHLDVAANLDFALQRSRAGGPGRADVVELLGIEPLLPRRPHTLSGGEQQRVAIGRALLRNPSLLLLDEPLTGLDGRAATQCLASLGRVQRELGLPMLFVSHRLEEVQALADRVLILEHGRITHRGDLLELAGRLDTQLADDEAAAAVVEVSHVEEDTHYGLLALAVDGYRMWVPGEIHGQPRRLRIPARDVSVCREKPAATSILNVLPATLEDERDAGPAHCLLRLRLREQYLLARITRRSRDELGLKRGERLYAQVKSTALLRAESTA